MAASRTARRLLREHFLRRFLDNDLISPNADRHEVLVLLNGVPSVLFPLLTLSHFHVNIIAVVRMIVVHAAVTMGAGAYAFVTILLLRELLRVLLGPRGFRRVAGLVQAALVVALGTTLLLLPAIASNVPAKWLRGGGVWQTR